LNLIHGFVYIGMFSSSVNFLHHVLCLFIFVTVLILFQLSFFKSSQKVVNGVGFARWPPWSFTNSVWHSNTHCLQYIDQLFCHCVFIYFNLHWQWLFLHDDSFYCFCLLAESHKTISQSVNPTHFETTAKNGISVNETSKQLQQC